MAAATGSRGRTRWKGWRRWSGINDDALGLQGELVPNGLISRSQAVPLIPGKARIRWSCWRSRGMLGLASSCMNVKSIQVSINIEKR